MKALVLHQGYTVFRKTSRDASHKDDTRGSTNRGCSAFGKFRCETGNKHRSNVVNL